MCDVRTFVRLSPTAKEARMRPSTPLVAALLVVSTSPAAFAQKEPPGKPALEQVFADPTYQLTGVAVSAKGRLFTNYPVWSPVHKYCLVEVLPGGKVKPYPNEEMNSWKTGDDGIKKWVSVQAD